MPNVEVFSKPGCVACNATYRHLDKMGVSYDVTDISQNPEAHDMLVEKKFTAMPVVVVDGNYDKAIQGFKPEALNEILSA